MTIEYDAALRLTNKIYKDNPLGCCLHIVLDDRNIEDKSVLSCIDTARVRNHKDCLALALMVLNLSKTQRLKLSYNHE